ncbi:MgtC/SapB family protein [Gorillibacterium sp. sgz500922]|uniref:MgtC/SapB family protein n=1 Tax=Gorillibacterium sp. sgz500922 TaxID=3446694 RepID=UPI003F671E3E
MEFYYLLRIGLAGLCGLVIGYERKSRMKEAGIRTHFVVAIGASLMMVISKYGFGDILGDEHTSLDPSRLAAQVVSGVGFLGAGMIFMQKQTVKGLTTAAGMWATAGIGMAIGSGLYLTGLGVTFVIVAAQLFFHSRFSRLATGPKTEQLTLRIAHAPDFDSAERIRALFRAQDIVILHFHAERIEPSERLYELSIKLPANLETDDLLVLLGDIPQIISLDVSV